MTQTKSLHSGNEGPLLSPREEAERFAVAAARSRERAQQDPAYAEQVLRNIGYYEMMEQHQEDLQNDANGLQGADSPQKEALQR